MSLHKIFLGCNSLSPISQTLLKKELREDSTLSTALDYGLDQVCCTQYFFSLGHHFFANYQHAHYNGTEKSYEVAVAFFHLNLGFHEAR